MAQDYKVTAVSGQPPRQFETKYGPLVSYKIKLEGVSEVVEITKKPDSPVPKEGDSLYGTLDMSGQYGPKFKSERRADNSFGGGGNAGSKPAYQPKDEKAIQAMWAIGQAVAANGERNDQKIGDYTGVVFDIAVELFNMVDLVKNNGVEEKAEPETPKSDLEAVADLMDAPVDLSEIPF